MPTNDIPATDAELEQVWGTPATQDEVGLAIGVAAANFDCWELSDVCCIHHDEIAEALANGDLEQVGEIVARVRREHIADVASKALYGKTGVIHERQVKV